MSTAAPSQSESAQMSYNSGVDTRRENFFSGQTGSIGDAFRNRGATVTINTAETIRSVHFDQDSAFAALFANTSGVHCYYLIQLRFDNGGDAHITAAYHSSGKIFGWNSHLYFFEPNHGEFKLSASAASIAEFFRNLAECYMHYKPRDSSTESPKRLTDIIVTSVLM